jgi:hypothetical protein
MERIRAGALARSTLASWWWFQKQDFFANAVIFVL